MEQLLNIIKQHAGALDRGAAQPRFGTVTFHNATINGQSLSNFSPVALDASNGNGYEDHTSAISGGTTFSVTYEQE